MGLECIISLLDFVGILALQLIIYIERSTGLPFTQRGVALDSSEGIMH